ncbi:MAG: thioredoxin family protein [Oceanococcaceae bacterium]
MALVLLGALPLIVGLRLWGSTLRTQALAMLMLILPLGSLALLPQLSTQPASEEVAVSEAGDALWSAYSPERLQALRQDGQPVFVNLTADWCLSCKFNERVALDTPEVRQAFAQTGVTALRGDWTLRDPQITALLEAHGRSGVPLYLLYAGPTGRPPEILPQLLTPGRVVAALESTRSLSR